MRPARIVCAGVIALALAAACATPPDDPLTQSYLVGTWIETVGSSASAEKYVTLLADGAVIYEAKESGLQTTGTWSIKDQGTLTIDDVDYRLGQSRGQNYFRLCLPDGKTFWGTDRYLCSHRWVRTRPRSSPGAAGP